MRELVMIGFADKHRAIEVLPQLQRLRFDWCADLQNAIAVEVEADGRLRLHHSQLLDPASSSNTTEWKLILSSIVPISHTLESSSSGTIAEARAINRGGGKWLKSERLDANFLRDAAALLQPGHSAILAIIREASLAPAVLMGYSYVVLRANIDQVPTPDNHL
jgi:uncharacterized membrane protein